MELDLYSPICLRGMVLEYRCLYGVVFMHKDNFTFTYMLENYTEEEEEEEEDLFCKPVDGRLMSLEVFNIIYHFLEENEINQENCT
jgi:lipoate-protein ligase A